MPFNTEDAANRDSEDFERHWREDSRLVPGWWIIPGAVLGVAVIVGCFWVML